MKWIVKWGPFEWTEKTKADALMRVESVIRERGAFRAYVTIESVEDTPVVNDDTDIDLSIDVFRHGSEKIAISIPGVGRVIIDPSEARRIAHRLTEVRRSIVNSGEKRS